MGEPGRKAVISRLPALKREREIDFVIANGENSAAGRGITPKISIDLLRCGVAVLTSGDHIWDQKEIVDYLPTEPRLLRPLNYTAGTPGNGSVVLETAKGKVAVINGQGRTFMNPPLENPIPLTETEAARMRGEGAMAILVDFHAEASSEKIAFGRVMDGKVSAVIGTHTHVQTSDERIFPGGTAYLTDAGMCGPDDSVLGRDIESVLWRFRTGMPTRFPIAKGPVRLSGVVVDVDAETGMALKIKRISELSGDTENSPDSKVVDGGE